MTTAEKRNTGGLRPEPPSPLAQLFGARKMIAQRWPQGIIDRVAAAAEREGITGTEWTLRTLLERLDALDDEARLPAVEYLLDEGVEGCRHPTDALRQMGEMRRCGICGERV